MTSQIKLGYGTIPSLLSGVFQQKEEKITDRQTQQGRRNKRPGHSLRTLCRASRRLRDDPRRCREDAAELLRDDLVRSPGFNQARWRQS